jgi:hypothetical protein
MTASPARGRVLRIDLLLTGIFNVLALLVLVRDTPVVFTVFMFLGLMLFVVAMILLLGAVVADLEEIALAVARDPRLRLSPAPTLPRGPSENEANESLPTMASVF